MARVASPPQWTTWWRASNAERGRHSRCELYGGAGTAMGAGVPQLAVYVRGISSSRNLVRGPRTPQPHYADRDRLRSGVLRGGRQVLFWYMIYCGRSQANGGSACSISARGGTVQAQFATAVRQCATVFFLRPTPGHLITVLTPRGCIAVSDGCTAAAEWLGVRARLKRLLRDRAVRQGS